MLHMRDDLCTEVDRHCVTAVTLGQEFDALVEVELPTNAISRFMVKLQRLNDLPDSHAAVQGFLADLEEYLPEFLMQVRNNSES